MDKNLASIRPKVSVVMPVFNGESYLREAVGSILAQTLSDFELLIIDDGSTDRTAQIVGGFDDRRIRYIANEGNRGLVATLNKGFDVAVGEYVARMDCDDFCLPDRLRKQVDFLHAAPEVGACGTWYREVGRRFPTVMRCAKDDASIRCGMLFNPVMGHPTVMLRRKFMDEYRLRYDARFKHAEDYHLWTECAKYFRFGNVPEILMHYRVHDGQVTQSKMDEQMESAGKVRFELLRELGIDPTAEEFMIHQWISALMRPYVNSFSGRPVSEQLLKVDAWLCRLKKGNDLAGVYPEPEFTHILIERWVGVCVLHCIARGRVSWKIMSRPAIVRSSSSGAAVCASFVLKEVLQRLTDALSRPKRCNCSSETS